MENKDRELYKKYLSKIGRVWWRIDVWKSDEVVVDGDTDFIWTYQISNERMGNVDSDDDIPYFTSGTIYGVYDTPPKVSEIMQSFAAEMTNLAISISCDFN